MFHVKHSHTTQTGEGQESMGLLTGTIVIRDAKNKKSSMKVHFVSGTTLAAAETSIGALATAINDLCRGEIVSIQLSADVVVPATADDTADLTSDVEEKGRFMFRTAAGKSMRVSIPAWDEGFTQPNSKLIDQTIGEVMTFMSWFTSGTPICDSNGQLITAVDAAYEAYN